MTSQSLIQPARVCCARRSRAGLAAAIRNLLDAADERPRGYTSLHEALGQARAALHLV